MNIPYLMKRCTKCGRWLVASKVNFYKKKGGKYGLEAQCKECKNKQCKQWYKANKNKFLEYKKQWKLDNKDKIAEKDKQYREANKDKIRERSKQYREANKEKITERHKQYYEANKDKILEQCKQYRQDNKEKIAEYHKQYREDNKDKIAEYQKQYYQSLQGQVVAFNKYQRRRTKEERQGTGITKDQWLELMSFFDWRCAYSGETLTKDTRSIDHIVPLNSNGDNMIWNCVPMLRNLNSSKHDKDMLEWYKEQSFYDPKRLQKIYEWQEYAYNKWGKDEEYFNTNDIQIKLI